LTVVNVPEGRPLVSVVMVTYGGRRWVGPALDALAEHTAVPYELIVVDNASADDTPQLLGSLAGATVIFNDRNIGFGAGCNQGVLHAVGRYVCLLNSDAVVEPGWLEPLVEALENDPRVGAAVPRLLHLDGTLQEAAGVVGMEATTRALGDGESAEDPQYRFRRFVDYGSAACMLIRRSAYLRVGGFDPAYPMGYCEDVDLCFALADLGLRTVYEPRSRVRHVRWGSSSRRQADRMVFANQPILLARWGDRLAARPSFRQIPPPERRLNQARDADCVDRILVVTEAAWAGSPVAPRPAAIATEIQRGLPEARVTLLAGGATSSLEIEALLEGGVEVAVQDDWSTWLQRRRFHYSVVILTGPGSHQRFEALLSANQPQAARIYDLPDPLQPGAGNEAALAWADSVLCASPDGLAFASAGAPQTPAFLLAGPSVDPTALWRGLAHAGLAPSPEHRAGSQAGRTA
jgi:GT2 family glycosyltransferase